MSKYRRDESVADPDVDYQVGYGKPPIATRFGVRPQPDRSKASRPGNKPPVPDIASLLDRPIQAKINGKLKAIHPHEAMLHGLFKRGMEGEIRAIQVLVQLWKRAGLLDPPDANQSSVIHVPAGVPVALASRLVRTAGAPPWDSELFDQMQADYDRDVAYIDQLKSELKAASE